jgi:glycosyltransferase involved in cell wall biosynthesis
MPDVILPVLDERDALPGVLASLPAGFRPIVVDNGSTDGSGALAANLGATVVHEPQRGFGAACFAGLTAATDEIVCFMDCDGSLDGGDLPLVADPVASSRADLVLGRRVADRGSWPRHARLGNRVLSHRVRRRCGIVLTDLGPMRAARRIDLLELGLTDRRFGWPLEMVVRAADAGWRVHEVPIPYHPRTGRSKVTGTVRGTLRTVRDMSAVLREGAAAAGSTRRG